MKKVRWRGIVVLFFAVALMSFVLVLGCQEGSNSGGLPGGQATRGQVLRGRYLVVSFACADCHSPGKLPGDAGWLGGYVEGTPGQPFEVGPNVYSYPANLSSDQATGLGNWTPQQIFDALREGKDDTGRYLAPPMPDVYRFISDEDTWAIVAYLRSIKPTSNAVPASGGDWTAYRTHLPPLPAYPAASENNVP